MNKGGSAPTPAPDVLALPGGLGRRRRTQAPGRALTVIAALVLLIGYQVYALFMEQHGAPSAHVFSGRVTTPEVVGPTSAGQMFRLEADGFDSVTIHAARAGERVAPTIFFKLFEVLPDESGQPGLERLIFRAPRHGIDVVARGLFTVRFPQIEQSAGRLYRFEVTVPNANPGGGIVLQATRDNVYRAGAFIIDGREQWGDLMFSTSAGHATAFARLRRQFGSSFFNWVLFAVLALQTAALATLAYYLMFAPRPPAERTALVPVVTWRPVRVYAVVALVAMAGAVATLVSRARSIDLVEMFPDAEKRTSLVRLHQAFDVLDVTIGGDTKRSIFAHPSSRIIWRIEVPPNATLITAAALRPDAWTKSSDGVIFMVGLSDGVRYAERFRKSIAPYPFAADRRWVPISVDLSPYAGQQVEVIFNTNPGEFGNTANDAAVWGAPRIVIR